MQVTKKVTSPLPTTDSIFYAGTGMLLCRSEDKVGYLLRDLAQLGRRHCTGSAVLSPVLHTSGIRGEAWFLAGLMSQCHAQVVAAAGWLAGWLPFSGCLCTTPAHGSALAGGAL